MTFREKRLLKKIRRETDEEIENLRDLVMGLHYDELHREKDLKREIYRDMFILSFVGVLNVLLGIYNLFHG